MAHYQLGTAGEKFDLVVRRGATTGPFVADMIWANATPVDLTGVAIRGWICRRAGEKKVAPITVVVLDAVNGQYSFELTDENSLLVPPDADVCSPAHYWFLEMLNTDGRIIPLYTGDAPCWRGNV